MTTMDALHLAAAVEILTGDASLTAICSWCLYERDPYERVGSRRVGGDCMFCAYSGPDTHVASLKPESFDLTAKISVDAKDLPALPGDLRYTPGYFPDDVSITWICVKSDGTQVGGAYASHHGAGQTMREFPVYFAGCRIVPGYHCRHGYGGLYAVHPMEPDQVLNATHGVA